MVEVGISTKSAIMNAACITFVNLARPWQALRHFLGMHRLLYGAQWTGCPVDSWVTREMLLWPAADEKRKTPGTIRWPKFECLNRCRRALVTYSFWPSNSGLQVVPSSLCHASFLFLVFALVLICHRTWIDRKRCKTLMRLLAIHGFR